MVGWMNTMACDARGQSHNVRTLFMIDTASDEYFDQAARRLRGDGSYS